MLGCQAWMAHMCHQATMAELDCIVAIMLMSLCLCSGNCLWLHAGFDLKAKVTQLVSCCFDHGHANFLTREFQKYQ